MLVMHRLMVVLVFAVFWVLVRELLRMELVEVSVKKRSELCTSSLGLYRGFGCPRQVSGSSPPKHVSRMDGVS